MPAPPPDLPSAQQVGQARIGRRLGAALFFIGFGAAALWLGRDLPVGTAGEMGVGYTPRALATGCIAVGALLLLEAVLVRAVRDPIAFAWRPAVFVTLLVLGFAALLPRLGLPLTIALVTLAAGLSGETFRWPVLIATAAALAALATTIFAWLLRLQVPVWPLW